MANKSIKLCIFLLLLFYVTGLAFHQDHGVESGSESEGIFDFENFHQQDRPTFLRGNRNYEGGCALPTSWHGRWFQSGLNLQAIGIDQKSIATKGICLESHEDKFLFYDKATNCHKCLVINERHVNVLQYKESPDCEWDKDSLENLCSSINGDAQLFSLFRLDAEAEECPFRGAPFNMTYNRGHGECKMPVSRVEACTYSSRLLLKFQACPDVEKTESKTEELECLAHWREGSNHYLMGKVESPLGSSNYEEKYRCFIWDRVKAHDKDGQLVVVGYRVAQSGDATCVGIQSATEGAQILTLTKLSTEPGPKCSFPHWITARHWQELDGTLSIRSHHHKNTTLHIMESARRESPGGNQFGAQTGNRFSAIFKSGSRLVCTSRHDVSAHHSRVLAHHIDGCKSEYFCVNFFKRDSHVVEVELESSSENSKCESHLATANRGWLTLISASASSNRCPSLGKYMTSGVTSDGRVVRDSCGGSLGDFKALAVGCGDGGRMEFISTCATQEPITSYACHGSWREGPTGFLIASPTSRSSGSAVRRVCFVYTESEGGLRVSSSSESCRQNMNPGIEGNWAFNLTTQGPCAEKLTSGVGASFPLSLSPILSVILPLFWTDISS